MKTGRYLSHSPLYPYRLRHSRCPMNICSPPGLLRGNWHIIVNIGWMSDCILPTLIWNTFYHFKYSHSLQSLEAFHRYYLTVGRTNQGAVESREMGRGNKQNPWQIKIVGGWICFQSEPDALVLKIFSSRKAFFFFLNPLFNFFFSEDIAATLSTDVQPLTNVMLCLYRLPYCAGNLFFAFAFFLIDFLNPCWEINLYRFIQNFSI